MRLTIIPIDNFVAVDGDSSHQPLDLSTCGIPVDVHALQWFETRGWIEFNDPIDPFAPKPPNQEITELPQWVNNCMAVWNAWTPSTPVNAPTDSPQPTTTGNQIL
jgi:hypothetical protein